MEEVKKVAVSLNLDRGMKRYTLMYRGVQDYANKHTGWTLIWDHFPEIKLRKCKSGDKPAYDGIIGRIKYEAYEEAERLKIPCVNQWYNSTLANKIPSCLPNFKTTGKLAVEHLLNRGFKNIINVDFSDSSAAHFLEGAKEILDPHKYKIKKYRFNRIFADTPVAWEKQLNTFGEWIKEWEFPLAICCSSPIIVVATYLQEHKVRMPEDVALIVAGEEEGFCETIEPNISSIDTDYWRQGYEAARMLHQQFKGELKDKLKYIEPIGVVARESTDTYATEDEVVRDALRFIADNIDKGIHVGDIVDKVPVSRSSLENRFKESVGHTIKDEIDRLRVISSKRLLADRQIKIKDICTKAGFNSALHMRRVFQKGTGMTPGEYRASLKNL